MQAVENGNFDIDITVNARNEVYQLARDCDIAVKKIRDLMAQNREEQEIKRKLELRSLQAQINPHFLYNTLDSIIWMIELGENERAIDMTSSLARFFRIGISRGEETISVTTEIEYMETYLGIQKQRYKDKLSYEIAFSPDLHSSQILKLLLQPLVENAIYHGIKNIEGPGLIRIQGTREGQSMVIRISDNGVGMEPVQLAALRDGLIEPRPSNGVGVRNVQERIHVYFGLEYGVSFESAPARDGGDRPHPDDRGEPALKNRSVLFLLAVAVLGAVSLTVFYRGARLLSPVSAAPRKVIVIFKTIDYRSTPFWGNVRDGVTSAGEDLGITVSIRGPAQESDVQGQIDIVQQSISEKPDAIVLAAADYNLLVPAAKAIKGRRIPLVCIDSFLNSDDADVRIGTDSYEGGQKCAAALLRSVHPGDLVAIMSYVKGSSTAIDRESGARDALDGRVRILETLYSNADADLAYSQAARLIARTPDLRGIVALNDPTARGAARALDESGKAGTIALVGFDNSLLVLRYLERGIIRDTVVQKPFNMGYLGIKVARELIGHKRPSRFINTGSVDISRANMLQPENQKLLFPVAEGQPRPGVLESRHPW